MLYERWRRVVREHGDELAMCDAVSGERWTFSELARQVEAEPVSDSALIFPRGQGVDFILGVLAGWKAGRVVCPLEKGQSAPAGLAEIPGLGGPGCQPAPSGDSPDGMEMTHRDHQAALSRSCSAQVPVGESPTGAGESPVLPTAQSGAVVSILPPGCVHLKMTSASTGSARAIAFTADQLSADLRNIVETMGLRRDWPNVGVISLAHSYGFSNLVLPLLLEGIPMVFAGSPLPEALRRAADGFEGMTLAAVPAMWRTWSEVDAIPRNIRLAISAGAPLPLELERCVFDQAGLKIHNFYGSSECGGIAYDLSENPRTDTAFVGEAMKNVSLAVGVDGCLEVRSAAVGQTYVPEPDERLRAGCFRTTDLARIEDGRVFLEGRATDVIHVAGRKVAPESIEQVLRTHPAVRECVVFSVPVGSVERGESIVACVATGAGVKEGELKNHLAERLPGWQVPRHWWLVPELAVNERGKVSRAQWRERYLTEGRRQKAEGRRPESES